MDAICAGMETRGIEVGRSAKICFEEGSFDGATLGNDTGDRSTVVSLHCPNILWRLVVASSWAL